jgi:hypothetical protein
MAHIGTRGFDSIGGEVVSTTAFVLEKFKQHEFKGGFARLVDGKSEAEKEKSLLEAVQNPDCGWFYRACSEDFKKIPGCPVAYWASENVKKIFVSQKLLSEYFELCQGLSTSDNNRFIRFWYEVKKNKISILNSSNKNPKWFPLNKGGGFRKWYGNNLDIINWEDNGEELKRLQPKSVIRNSNKYLKSGVTWGKITSALFSARITSNGYLFSDAGMKAFCENDNHLLNLVGLFCSKITSHLLSMLSETLNFEQGNISRIPYINVNSSVVNQVIKYSNLDWDTYETSWDFKTNPFLNQDIKSYDLKTAYEKIRAVWLNMTNEMKRLEKENNEIFIRAYGLEDELSPEVPLNEITLTCNPNYRYGNSKSQHELENLLLSDTIKEFISYSVGCMFGRYSIDKKGLVLADKGQNLDDFLEIVKNPLFMPDKDNVIPIMDIDWFKDDMAERFKQFLKTVSGEENYEKNLEFIENAIGKDIRKFFLNDFYNYHVKMYKKRPVYWLFSSPNGSFNAFIYMHRYRKDTVSIVLNDYLREFRAKLEAALENFIHIESSLEASQKEKLKAKKEEEKIKKVINEIEEYEREVLYPLASEQIEIDLDDGVKVNYPKFGKALKKIPGLSD